MKSIDFPLVQSVPPVIELFGFSSVIVTGAMIPVLSEPLNTLGIFSPVFKNIDHISAHSLSGDETGKIVTLKDFSIGFIYFRQCDFFVPDERKSPYSFLLSSPLFQGVDFGIHTIDSKFSLEAPDDFPDEKIFSLDIKDGELTFRNESI